VEHGSLYPALHRLREQGWIQAEWKTTENNQRARYYRLTAKGKKRLTAEETRWNQMVQAIARVMKAGAVGGFNVVLAQIPRRTGA
jgi:DNA-binding PadR family transcriptional regulator